MYGRLICFIMLIKKIEIYKFILRWVNGSGIVIEMVYMYWEFLK